MSATIGLPKIKAFKVGDEELNVDDLLKRDYDDVREASQVLPSAMAWLGWQRAYYQEQLYLAEQTVKAKKGELTIRFKQDGLESEGYSVRATDSAVEAVVNVHPETMEAHKRIAKFTRIVSNLTAYIFAFERKIELVRTGEATHRRVADNEPLSDEEIETNRLKESGE